MSMKGFFPFHESPHLELGINLVLRSSTLWSVLVMMIHEYVRRIMQKHNKHFLSEAAWKFHGVEAVALQKERNPIVTPERNNNIACSLIWWRWAYEFCVCACMPIFLRTCIFFKPQQMCGVVVIWWCRKTEHQTMSLYQYIFFSITHKYTHFNLFKFKTKRHDDRKESLDDVMFYFSTSTETTTPSCSYFIIAFHWNNEASFNKEREKIIAPHYFIFFARDSF